MDTEVRMPFTKGDPNINRQGRRKDSATSVSVPKTIQRTVLKQLSDRAAHGDPAAVETLAIFMLRQA